LTDPPLESFISTVIGATPEDVATPRITPVSEFRMYPLGRTPPEIDHAQGGVPPDPINCAIYGTPTCPDGKVTVVVITSGGGGAMVSEYTCVSVADTWSVTRIVNDATPTPVGVPLMIPVAASRANPAASAPALTDHA
jgi:hypothetical protein